MKRIVIRLLIFMCTMLSLSGCWDNRVLQDISYASALGIDYVNDQFVVYVQMVDFSSVGKSEGGKKGEDSKVYVGKGKGQTFALAWNDLYNSTQQSTYFGQITALVFSQQAMLMHLEQTMDTLERFTPTRYTPWMFATTEPISDLFAVSPTFPESPLMTLLHSPQANYHQHSMIQPMKLLNFAALYKEPSSSLFVPSLSIQRNVWTKGEEKIPIMVVDGAVCYHRGQKPRWMSKEDLIGMRWMEEETVRTPLALYDDKGNINALLICKDPHVRVRAQLTSKGIPVYDMHVKVLATITQLNVSLTKEQLLADATAKIQEEIRATYATGQKNKVDVYHLEELMFRQKYADWKELTRAQTFPLTAHSLGDMEVFVEMTDTGKKTLKF